MIREEVNLEPGTPVRLTSLRTGREVECVVGEPLGEGGTALVYGGKLGDGTDVVLKVQRWVGKVEPAFEHETQLFGKLAHRNVVHCVGAGAVDGLLVLAFRRVYDNPLLLLARASLADELQRDHRARYPSLPLDTAVDLAYELLNALEYLERIELVHHDVKLANILIDPGPCEEPLPDSQIFGVVVRRQYRAVLIDFGATRTIPYLEAWNDGVVLPGPRPQITPFYAPPESVVESRRRDGKLGYAFDPSLDVYAAALVIYAMFTGHPPYNHLREPPSPDDLEALVGIKSAERRGDIEPISADTIRRVVIEGLRLKMDRAAFDAGLYRLLVKRLDPDPSKRGTAAELKRDFERFARIKKKARTGGDVPGRARVALPFVQELVEATQGEHPLLKAARLCGDLERSDPGDPQPPRPRPRPRAGAAPAPRPRHVTRRIAGSVRSRGPRPKTDRRDRGPARKPPSSGAIVFADDATAALQNGRPSAPEGEGRAPRAKPRPPSPKAAPPRAPAGATPRRRPAGGAPPSRGYPAPAAANAPHCLVSAVLDDPFLLSRERTRTTVGRAPDADVRIVSDRVSRIHADIRWDGKAFVLSDRGSTNGTEVNGVTLTGNLPLHGGDRISFGGFEFEVCVLQGALPQVDDGQGETRVVAPGAAVGPDELKVPDLSGTLGNLDLRDVIEVLEWKRRGGTLRIEPAEGGPGALFVDRGRIIHAERGATSGLDAALELLCVQAGRFVFTPERPDVPATLLEFGNDKLLEMATERDG